MTRSIEELTRIQHLWADAGDSHACALGDALEHVARLSGLLIEASIFATVVNRMSKEHSGLVNRIDIALRGE